MPKPENNNTDTVIDDVNKNTDKNLTDVDNNNDNGGTDKQTVPLSTFLKTKDEIKTLKDKLQKIEDDKKKAKERELEEQGKLKELLTAKEEEIKSLTQTLKPKAEEYDRFRQEEIESIKKILGDKWDDDFGNLSLPALRKMAVTLSSKKDDPNLDKGSNGAGGDSIVLTAAQKKEAYEKFPYATKEKAEEYWYYALKQSGKIK